VSNLAEKDHKPWKTLESVEISFLDALLRQASHGMMFSRLLGGGAPLSAANPPSSLLSQQPFHPIDHFGIFRDDFLGELLQLFSRCILDVDPATFCIGK
jgi:hypothetical protein